ncbi:hypothetical protein V5O48_014968, partial [Marasmius crinis-equi]
MLNLPFLASFAVETSKSGYPAFAFITAFASIATKEYILRQNKTNSERTRPN